VSLLWMMALLACGGDGGSSKRLETIPGTTHRIAAPVPVQNLDLDLKIMANATDCDVVRSELEKTCLPHIDRSTGEVRLSFQLRVDGDVYPMPLTAEHIRVFHAGSEVLSEWEGQSYTLVPHEERNAKQMFILIIDGSSSMDAQVRPGVSRMDAVRNALLRSEVRDAFFSGATGKSVVIFEFTQETRPLGGQITILENQRDYANYIKKHLRVSAGYTHLYDAVEYATGPLLETEEIKGWLQRYSAVPTVVVLTDGFNNLERNDLCKTNARRLTRLLEHLQRVRQGRVGSVSRPTVYTVGFGQPVRPGFKLPELETTEVDARKLCGRYMDYQIDGNLEDVGIDNPSLSWIAELGGGNSFVRNNSEGLGEAFQAAAAKRYEWFEVRYRVGFSNVRRSFITRLRLDAFATAEASVEIHPSAWLDAPPGTPIGEGWTMPTPYRHTLTVVLPIMGMLILMSYLGAAWFNTRRVIFGRTRPPRPPQDDTA
jgi:hypothetical protein